MRLPTLLDLVSVISFLDFLGKAPQLGCHTNVNCFFTILELGIQDLRVCLPPGLAFPARSLSPYLISFHAHGSLGSLSYKDTCCIMLGSSGGTGVTVSEYQFRGNIV